MSYAAAPARRLGLSWRVAAPLGTLLVIALLAVLTALQSPSAVAQNTSGPQVCYAVDEGAGTGAVSHIVRIDNAEAGTAAATLVGTVSAATTNVESLAYRNQPEGSTTASLWAVDADTPAGTGALMQMDAADATWVSAGTVSGDVDGLTWVNDNDSDPSNDELWAVLRDHATADGPDGLVQLDPADGSVISGPFDLAAPTGTGTEGHDYDGLTWDSTSDTLYSVVGGDSAANTLVTVTKAGVVSIVGTAGNTGAWDVEGLGADDAGNLYAVTGEDGETAGADGDDDRFWRVNKTTGAMTEVLQLNTTALGSNTDWEGMDCGGFYPGASIGLAKSVSSGPTLASDGNWDVDYTFTIENNNSVELSSISIDDDLENTFGAGNVLTGPTEQSNDCGTGGTTLAANTTCTIVWSAEIDDLSPNTDYNNTATVTAETPGGQSASDQSVDGTDPDGTDNDNNFDESGSTTINIGESPAIGLAKALTSGPTPNGANYDMTFTFTVENMGNVDLDNVDVSDDYAANFGAGTAVVGTPNRTTDDCGGTVAAGESCTIVEQVTMSGLNEGQSYDNSATATGDSPNDTTVTDDSISGDNPDPGNDGSAADDSGNTTFTVASTSAPAVGIAKQITSGPTKQSNGDYEVTFEFTVKNMGNQNLTNVVITDGYSAMFPGGTVSSPTPVSDTCIGATLAPNAECKKSETVTISDVNAGDTGSNTASVTAKDPSDNVVTDSESANGTNPDTDNDGDATDDSSSTPVNIPNDENGRIGMAKALTSGPTITSGGDDWEFKFTFVIENLGDVALTDITHSDNYDDAFGTGNAGTPDVSNDCPESLEAGAKCEIVETVTVSNLTAGEPYENSASVTAKTPAGTTVSDDSTEGSDPDTDDDGDANDESEKTKIQIPAEPKIGLAKKISNGPIKQSDGSYDIDFKFVVENFGTGPLSDITLTDNYAAVFEGATVTGPTAADITNDCEDGLDPQETCEIVHKINVKDVDPADSFANTATVKGKNSGGVEGSDVSMTGDDPDTDGDNDATDEDDKTAVVIPSATAVSTGGIVFEDTNGNGIHDPGEGGLEGVEVIAYAVEGNNIVKKATAHSGPDGAWSTMVEPGDYRYSFKKKNEYDYAPKDKTDDEQADSDVNTSGEQKGFTDTVNVTAETSGITAGYVPSPGSLTGTVVLDKNNDGVKDAEEGALAGTTVRLYQSDSSGSKGAKLSETTTAADGKYSFDGLAGGKYLIEFEAPSGHLITSPADGQTTVDVASAEDETLDALAVEGGTVSGVVFVDSDKDGIRDSGEAGRSGVTIKLYSGSSASGTPTATTTTDSEGKYSFANVRPGTYVASLTAPTGYKLTTQNKGDEETKDSDYGATSGVTAPITVGPGQSVASEADGGLQATSSGGGGAPGTVPIELDSYNGPYNEFTPSAFDRADVLPQTVEAPLAVTGSTSPLLVTIAIAMLGVGGVLMIGARRERADTL